MHRVALPGQGWQEGHEQWYPDFIIAVISFLEPTGLDRTLLASDFTYPWTNATWPVDWPGNWTKDSAQWPSPWLKWETSWPLDWNTSWIPSDFSYLKPNATGLAWTPFSKPVDLNVTAGGGLPSFAGFNKTSNGSSFDWGSYTPSNFSKPTTGSSLDWGSYETSNSSTPTAGSPFDWGNHKASNPPQVVAGSTPPLSGGSLSLPSWIKNP